MPQALHRRPGEFGSTAALREAEDACGISAPTGPESPPPTVPRPIRRVGWTRGLGTVVLVIGRETGVAPSRRTLREPFGHSPAKTRLASALSRAIRTRSRQADTLIDP